MIRRIIIVGLCVLLLFAVVGCSDEPTTQDATTPNAPETSKTDVEATDEPEPDTQVSAEELYGQIESGMSYNEVMTVMAGHDPFLENEGAVDTPAGRITTQNVSWKIGKHIITAIFQDDELLGKDLTKM